MTVESHCLLHFCIIFVEEVLIMTCMKYMYMYMLLDIDKTTNCNDQSVCMFFKLNTVKSLLFVGGGCQFSWFSWVYRLIHGIKNPTNNETLEAA